MVVSYIGRQLVVSYIGRQVYGENIYLSVMNLAWDIWRPTYRPPKYVNYTTTIYDGNGLWRTSMSPRGTVFLYGSREGRMGHGFY